MWILFPRIDVTGYGGTGGGSDEIIGDVDGNGGMGGGVDDKDGPGDGVLFKVECVVVIEPLFCRFDCI